MTCRHPPPLLKKSRPHLLVQTVAQCFQTNEKSIFRFLLFLVSEIWSFSLKHLAETFVLSKKMHNVLKRIF